MSTTPESEERWIALLDPTVWPLPPENLGTAMPCRCCGSINELLDFSQRIWGLIVDLSHVRERPQKFGNVAIEVPAAILWCLANDLPLVVLDPTDFLNLAYLARRVQIRYPGILAIVQSRREAHLAIAARVAERRAAAEIAH